MPVKIERLDHLVLTASDVEASQAFYQRVLGLRPTAYKPGRPSLHFGTQKINLHRHGAPDLPINARNAAPGTADLCFITRAAPAKVVEHLRRCGVEIEEGPVEREGTLGRMVSIYFRDPDENLIEVATYTDEPPARSAT
jgi:catechol 2,3-dioxygenase-like lactoylglutathione lyase family enzyme